MKVALHRLGLGFMNPEEQEKLMGALDPEGLGLVRYADFVSFFEKADPRYKSNIELVDRWVVRPCLYPWTFVLPTPVRIKTSCCWHADASYGRHE